MKFFIYSRKSVCTGKGESIENQIEMCKKYINTKFSDVSHADITIYEDEGFSAKNTDRPRFRQMLKDIKRDKPNFVVCYRLDRISRNVSDFSSLIEDLNDRSISFICIKEEFDTSKPMGKAMMYIASVFAQLERETIAERVRDNMLMLARTGRWLGGTTPTGYTSEKLQELIIDGKMKSSCRLKENPDEIGIVKMMFEKYLELRSISGVSKYLIEHNIKSRADKYYSLPGIKDILQNPVYCAADKDALAYFTAQGSDVCFEEKDCSNKYGLLSYNKRDYTKKHAPRQPMDKWIIAMGRHPGLISGKNWAAVQSIIKDNTPTGKNPAKMHNDYSLLSGMIYCEKCGSRMFAKHRSGKNGNPEIYDYICSSKLIGSTALCNCQNINGQQADASVCEHLVQYTVESSRIFRLLSELKSDLKKEPQDDPVSVIESQIKKCNDEMDNLINALSQGSPPPAFTRRVNAKISQLDRKLSALTWEHQRLQNNALMTSDKELQLDMLAATLSGLKNSLNTLSVHDKRSLIKLLAKRIVWDGKDIHIFLDGE